jgi:hypothetical protein
MSAPKIIAPKIIVFDLDETLGFFTQVNILWETIDKTEVTCLQQLFNDALDLYPEVLRPDIQTALKYVYDKKCKGKCDKIMIYTNNKREKEWTSSVAHYFKYLLNIQEPDALFDQIIHAFKINGEIVEPHRTTHKKTHCDLISCTKMPDETQICFLDDSLYEKMNNINVYYINFEPYIHHLPFTEMVRRFADNMNNSSPIKRVLNAYGGKTNFVKTVSEIVHSYNFPYIKKRFGEYEMEYVISRRIIEKIKLFFKISDDGPSGRFVRVNKKAQYSRRRSSSSHSSPHSLLPYSSKFLNKPNKINKTRKKRKIW